MILFSYSDDAVSVHRTLDVSPNPAEFQMHAHERLELYCFLAGVGSYMVEGTQYELQPGDVTLIREAEAHKLLISPEAPYERVAVHFDPELLRPMDPDLRLLRPFYDRPLGQRNRYPMATLPDGFWRECLERMTLPGGDRVRLLSYLIPLLEEVGRLSDSAPGGKEYAAPLVAYVNRHLFEPLPLERLSREFYLSKSQINRTFRRATGSTAARYIEIKRLLAARGRIRRGEKPGEVSRECGFGDYSAFFRAYRAYFGFAPSEDRGK